MRTFGVLFAALLLGAAAAGVATFAGFAKKRKEARAGWNLVPIVVAAVDVPERTTLTMEVLSQRSIPEQFVGPEMVRPDLASYIVNRAVANPLQAGDPILWTDFADGTDGAALADCVLAAKPAVQADAARVLRETLDRLPAPAPPPETEPDLPDPAETAEAQGQVQVVVAAVDLAEGTVLERQHLKAAARPVYLVTASWIPAAHLERLVGQRLGPPVQANDGVWWQMLDSPAAPLTAQGCQAAASAAVAEARKAAAERGAKAWTWPRPAAGEGAR